MASTSAAWMLAASTSAALAWAAPGHAQISTDGTAGAATSLSGPDFTVGEGLGTVAGANLFHSFTEFNIQTGETATFTGSSGYDNVISRVTGPSASFIDGALTNAVPGADFYFINPNGATFGPNAAINSPEGFHVSTADRLNFANGDMLLAAGGAGSTFSAAAPESFGFLGGATGDLTINGSVLAMGGQGSSSLSAGEITLVGGGLQVAGSALSVTAVGDAAAVVDPTDGSTGGPIDGRVTIDGGVVDRLEPASPAPRQQINIRGGEIELTNGSTVGSVASATSDSADVLLQADAVTIESGSAVTSRTDTDRDGGSVTIATGHVSVSGSHISSETLGDGAAGALTIRAADTLLLADGARIFTSTSGSGLAGDIALAAPDITLQSGQIYSQTTGLADAGDVLLTADTIFAQDTLIASNAWGSDGNAGLYSLVASSRIDLIDSVLISTTISAGNAGAAHLEAPTIVLENALVNTGVTSVSTGQGGAITVRADTLDVSGAAPDLSGIYGGNFTTAGFTAGSNTDSLAGSIDIDVTGAIRLYDTGGVFTSARVPGNAGAITINAGELHIDGSVVNSPLTGPFQRSGVKSTGGGVNAGLTINAPIISLVNGASMTATVFNGGALGARAGDVDIVADSILMDMFSTISSESVSGGDAGTVTITVDELELLNGSSILSSAGVLLLNGWASDAGNGGDVNVTAESILIQGAAAVALGTAEEVRLHSNIGSFAGEGAGAAGSVNITANSLRLVEGGQITAFSNNEFGGGVVTLDVEDLEVSGALDAAEFADRRPVYGITDPATHDIGLEAALIADTFSSGDAGTILVQADDIEVLDGGVIRSSTSAEGRGGLIVVCCATSLAIDGAGSGLLTNSTPDSSGDAGQIVVKSATVTLENGGTVTVESEGSGAGGSIIIKAHDFFASNAGGAAEEATAIRTLVTGDAGIGSEAAGQVAILAGRMEIADGAIVSTDTTGSAPAGRILLRAGTLVLSGAETSVSSQSGSAQQGDAGLIEIAARFLEINGATVSTDSETGSGGQITLSIDDQLLVVNGAITTSVEGSEEDSDAGNIVIGVGSSDLTLNDNLCNGLCNDFDPFEFVPAPDPEDGVPDVIINQGGVIQANARAGSGGQVAVEADYIVNNGEFEGVTEAQSETGPDGEVQEEGTDFNLPDFVIVPDQDFESACEAQESGEASTFVLAVNQGVAPDPTAALPAMYAEGTDAADYPEAYTVACAAAARAAAEENARELDAGARGG